MPAPLSIEAFLDATSGRFSRKAYLWVLVILDQLAVTVDGVPQHVGGADLARYICTAARERFGFMAPTVFDTWGLRSSEDLGTLVFELVTHNIIAASPTDRPEAFAGAVDFPAFFGAYTFTPLDLAHLRAA